MAILVSFDQETGVYKVSLAGQDHGVACESLSFYEAIEELEQRIRALEILEISKRASPDSMVDVENHSELVAIVT